MLEESEIFKKALEGSAYCRFLCNKKRLNRAGLFNSRLMIIQDYSVTTPTEATRQNSPQI